MIIVSHPLSPSPFTIHHQANVLFYFTATGEAASFTEITRVTKNEQKESGIRLKELS